VTTTIIEGEELSHSDRASIRKMKTLSTGAEAARLVALVLLDAAPGRREMDDGHAREDEGEKVQPGGGGGGDDDDDGVERGVIARREKRESSSEQTFPN